MSVTQVITKLTKSTVDKTIIAVAEKGFGLAYKFKGMDGEKAVRIFCESLKESVND